MDTDRSASAKRLECLDGLRGVLALYVLLSHVAPFAALPPWVARPLSHGGAAVDVFFVLSGLVIMQSLESFNWRARGFLIARAARIFPVFLVMFTIAVAVQPLPADFSRLPWIGPDSQAHGIWSGGWPRTWLPEIIAHLTMIHGLIPDAVLPAVWLTFLGAAWSLSTEWQFYVLALVVGARVGPRRMVVVLLVLSVAGLLWQAVAPEEWRFSRAFLPNKAQYFALGIAGAAPVRGGAGVAWAYGVTLAATLLLCGLQGGLEKLLPPLVWTMCLAAQLQPGVAGLRIVARILRAPALLRLGALSYCIYLANEPVLKLLGLGFAALAQGNARWFTAVWVPCAIVLPLLLASWLHVSVELPAMRWAREYTSPANRKRAAHSAG